METTNNQELLNKYAGISSRIRRIFAYHYDQIQREIQAEVANINLEEDANDIIDQTTLFMEEFMNWPDPDNQEIFNDQITNGFPIFNGNPTLNEL